MKFIVAALNRASRRFVVYVMALAEVTIILFYYFSKDLVVFLTKTKIFANILRFQIYFLLDSVLKLQEYNRIYDYFINLLDN